MNPSDGTAVVVLSEGTMVNANVRLTRPLGEGAMGEVWVARHLTLKTDVAVKFISPILVHAHPDLVKRFEQEATVAAQIKSPHVVQTFDHGVMDGGMPYIVMELLEGQSLDEMLQHNGPLPLAVVSQVLVQVARALSKAHAVGVVHRDIKPDNIFITPMEDGIFCKLLDFGIAKQTQLPKVGGLTNPGVMIGTPEYMSPEQVMSSSDVDHRTDLWALAVTAYHILTGQLPFTADTLGRLCVLLLDAKFTPPSQLRPGLGPAVDAWFAHAMAKDASQRFTSAREMARDFVRIVREQGVLLEEMSVSDLSTDGGALSGRGLGGPAIDAAVAKSGAAHGTLSGSASGLRRPPGARGAIIGIAVGATALIIGGVAAVVMLTGDDTQSAPAAQSASTLPEPSEAEPQPPEEIEPDSAAEAAVSAAATAAPSASVATSQTSSPASPKAKARRPKAAAGAKPKTAPKPPRQGRKDHGF